MTRQIGSCSFLVLVLSCLRAAASGQDTASRAQPAAVDRFGDPLPEHARARLGTTRFQAGGLINQVLYAPDGKSLATIDWLHAIRVWEAATGRLMREIGEPETDFREIAISPDGKALASIEYPGRIRLWDPVTGRERRRWHEAVSEFYASHAFSPDGRALAAIVHRSDRAAGKSETFVNVWDIGAPTERRRRLSGEWHSLVDLKFSPDGLTLAVASLDTDPNKGPENGSIRLFDLASGRERKRFAVEGFKVRAVAFSSDGKLVAAAVADRTIRLFDLVAGRERLPRLGQEPALRPRPPGGEFPKGIGGGRTGASCLAFSPDGSILAAGSSGTGFTGSSSLADVCLWDVTRGKELRHFPAHQGWVRSLDFSPDGRTLASSGAEPMIRLWDVATGREVLPQPGHRSHVRALVISTADGTVFTGGQDGTIRHWDLATGRELGVIASFANPADTLAIAPDGKTLLVGGSLGGRFALWSIAERREIRGFPRIEPRNPVRHVAFSPDGRTVASERRIWDTATGQVLVSFRDRDEGNNHNANFFPIFYSSDGKQVITTENEGARIWDIASGREARWAVRSRIHHDRVALSRDNRYLATGGLVARFQGSEPDPPIHLWELASGQEVATLVGHEESTHGLSFSPDGRLLASCSGALRSANDATIRVWDVATGRELRRFAGHRGAVNAVAFTPDGRSLVSGSEDGTGLVWDISELRGTPQRDAPLARESLQALWDELTTADARVAHRATWTLSVPSAVAFLGEHLRPAGSPDAQGIPAASGPIAPPEILRALRAIAALERIGTPEARAVIERVAGGDPGAIETREARTALVLMDSRPVSR